MENIDPSRRTRGEYLRAVRLSKNLRIEDVANELGYSATAISNLERTGRTKLDTFAEVVTFYKLPKVVVLALMDISLTKNIESKK